jgi:hypothetical protein
MVKHIMFAYFLGIAVGFAVGWWLRGSTHRAIENIVARLKNEHA